MIQTGAEKENLTKAKADNKAGPPGGSGKPKVNLAGEISCSNCGSEEHWQYEYLKLTSEEREHSSRSKKSVMQKGRATKVMHK